MVPASNTLADWTPISAIPVAPEIAPVLLTPPEKCGILRSSMPAEPAEMVPALLMPPVNVVARLTSMPVIAEMIPALLMPPRNFDAVTRTPALDALLNWLALVDEDAVAGREQIAADDDSTHYSAVEQGNAGLRRDRAAIDDVAGERRYRVLLWDGGRAEPDTDAAGGERAVIGDAAREGRNRNRGNAGVHRPDCPSVDDAAGDNGVVIESNSGLPGREDRAAVDDAAGKVRDELYKNASIDPI